MKMKMESSTLTHISLNHTKWVNFVKLMNDVDENTDQDTSVNTPELWVHVDEDGYVDMYATPQCYDSDDFDLYLTQDLEGDCTYKESYNALAYLGVYPNYRPECAPNDLI